MKYFLYYNIDFSWGAESADLIVCENEDQVRKKIADLKEEYSAYDIEFRVVQGYEVTEVIKS